MYKRVSFIIILFSIMGFQNQNIPDTKPMFFIMADEWKDIAKDEVIFEFNGTSSDSSYHSQTNHQVRLLSDRRGAPRLFFSDIETPVCADGSCKLANISLYWNLLGNYVGYSIPSQFPLTKFEHDHFEKEDYAKLHQLLLDDNSIIKRRKMSDLIDQVPVSPLYLNSKDLDGISGATKKEIKESVVKGGLYSCYTLWHIAHGEVKKKMKRYLQSIDSETLTQYFLYAPYKDYQQYALKSLLKENFKQHTKQLIQIFKSTDAVTKAYILKKIPSTLFFQENITSQIYNTFPDADINTRTLLIRKLKNAHPNAVTIVSKYVGYMSKNQLTLYFKHLLERPKSIEKEVISNVTKASNYKSYPYRYLIKEFLKNN